ncbi:MAG: hypothetical protein Q9191_002580 [Dirinaria sp. TL-2023a]
MASASSLTTSPPSLAQDISRRPADVIDSVQGQVASQHTANSRVSIASPPGRQPTTSQLASSRYVHQFRALLEHQRQVHEEERELWNTERSELLDEISKLREALRQAQLASPVGTQLPGASVSSVLGTSSSRHTSTGDEFWRGAGGRSDAQPTRTFSETSHHSSAAIGERLPSIREQGSPQQPRRSLLTESINGSARPSVAQVQIPGELDGIRFKQSSFSSSSHTSCSGASELAPHSPSPLSTSPTIGPHTSSQLGPPTDWNTKDAGHTPLARGSRYRTDGSTSAMDSSPTTPTVPETERFPSEPRPSAVRPPNERSDSYFSGVTDLQDEDPALSEPLNLSNSSSEKTQEFLKTLDSRLQEAAKASNDELTSSSDPNTAKNASSKETSESSEPEPKLRIKRSMNFGAEFGKLR